MTEFVSNLPRYLTHAPTWALLAGGGALILLLVGGGPLAGSLIMRSRRKEQEEMAKGRAVGIATPPRESAFFAGDSANDLTTEFSMPRTALEQRPERAARNDYPTVVLKGLGTNTTMIFETVETPEVAEFPDTALAAIQKLRPLDESPVQVVADLRPAWAVGGTTEWDVLGALDAELVEAESEAERLFREDPLGSWVLPPETGPDYSLEAMRTFQDMVALDRLTGIGADLDYGFTPWYITQKEAISA